MRKLALVFTCLLVLPASANAVTEIGVTGTGDPAPGGGPTDANCLAPPQGTESTACTSLRAAIATATNDNTGNIINLRGGTGYTKAAGGAGSGFNADGAAQPDFDIPTTATAGAITIRGIGGGPGDHVIDFKNATAADRVFDVPSGANLTLQNVTVTGGSWTFVVMAGFQRSHPADFGPGGNIRNQGTLALDGVAVTDGVNNVGNGGTGVASSGPSLTITNSTFSLNDARNGAIPSPDTSNSAGGGALLLTGGTANISRSTFTGNIGGRGAAIVNNGANATITSTTITGNTAATVNGGATTFDGGGLVHDSGSTDVLSSTIAGNTAAPTRAANIGAGNGDTINLASSIVANPLGGGLNCTRDGGGAPGISGGNGLQHPLDSACVAAPGIGDIGADPLLGPLASNGGATQTMALSSGSPAIDGGGSGCPALDQRGNARTDGNSDGVVVCDKGAFEAAAGTTPAPSGGGGGGSGGGGGAAPGGGTVPGGGGTGGGGGVAAKTFGAGKATANSDGSITLEVDCPGAGTVKVTDGSATASAAAKKKKVKPLINSATGRSTGSSTIKVKLKLSAAGKAKLKKRGKVSVKAKVTFTPTGGKAVSKTKSIVFKKPKK